MNKVVDEDDPILINDSDDDSNESGDQTSSSNISTGEKR